MLGKCHSLQNAKPRIMLANNFVTNHKQSISLFTPFQGRLSALKIILSGIGIIMYLNTLVKETLAHKTHAELQRANGSHVCHMSFDSLYSDDIHQISKKYKFQVVLTKPSTENYVVSIFDIKMNIPEKLLSFQQNSFYPIIELSEIHKTESRLISQEIKNIEIELTKKYLADVKNIIEKLYKIYNFFERENTDDKLNFTKANLEIKRVNTNICYFFVAITALSVLLVILVKISAKLDQKKDPTREKRNYNNVTKSDEIIKKKLEAIEKKRLSLALSNKEVEDYRSFVKRWTCPLGGNVIASPLHHPKYQDLFDIENLCNALKNNSYKYKNKPNEIDPTDFTNEVDESFYHKQELIRDIEKIESILKIK